jgi:hypothetical protein
MPTVHDPRHRLRNPELSTWTERSECEKSTDATSFRTADTRLIVS